MDVFISYATPKRSVAEAICRHLEAGGVRCWIAPRNIRPGIPWPSQITDAIREGRLFLLLFCADANLSEHVERELTLAAQYKLRLLPVKVGSFDPSGTFAYFLHNCQWLQAPSPRKPGLKQIEQAVSDVLKMPAPPPRRRDGVPRMAFWLSAVLLPLLLTLAFWAGQTTKSAPKSQPSQTASQQVPPKYHQP